MEIYFERYTVSSPQVKPHAELSFHRSLTQVCIGTGSQL